MIWLLYALLSSVAVAFATIFSRIGMRGTDPTIAALIRSVIASIFLLFASVVFKKFNGHTFQAITSTSMLFIVLGGVAIGLSWIFYLTALKYGITTQVAAIDRMSIIFTVLLCMLILGECFSIKVVAGSIVMAFGAYLIIG